jgi:hypothetical protein
VASLTATSSFPASFSLSPLLISPASTVHLYVVSMASSLACSSRISLSIARSGIGLSLLLGGMVENVSLFSATKSKEPFLCSETT